ncbi:hypothetical protein PT2222_110140 [Paraburkholderia tropica]
MPSTSASIFWRFEASVSSLLPLPVVTLQPDTAAPTAAAITATLSTKLLRFIIVLRQPSKAMRHVMTLCRLRSQAPIGLWSYNAQNAAREIDTAERGTLLPARADRAAATTLLCPALACAGALHLIV